jgi:hypothetical protein
MTLVRAGELLNENNVAAYQAFSCSKQILRGTSMLDHAVADASAL